MQSFYANYTPPDSDQEQSISVLVMQKSIKLGYKAADGTPQVEEWMLPDITSQYRFAGNESVVTLTGKRREVSADGDGLHKAIQSLKEYHAQPWRKKTFTHVFYKQLIAALIMLALLAGGYFLLAPWLSSLLAKKLPRKYEIALGEQVYNSMIRTYTVDQPKTKLAQQYLSELKFDSPYPVQVTVVKSSQVNAFALPGGHIVIYSAILEQMDDHSELAALLSHEFSHVQHRHATRSIFRRLGSKAFLSLLFGRTGMLTSLVLNNADELKSLKYSRSLEKEADLEGLKLLKDRNIDGRGFIKLMQHLQQSGEKMLPEIMTSHPNIAKRIDYLKSNEHFVAIDSADNKELPALFRQLKAKSDW